MIGLVIPEQVQTTLMIVFAVIGYAIMGGLTVGLMCCLIGKPETDEGYSGASMAGFLWPMVLPFAIGAWVCREFIKYMEGK